jgi:hypothetical protein
VTDKSFPEASNGGLQKVAALLGGYRVLSRRFTSVLDTHEWLAGFRA